VDAVEPVDLHVTMIGQHPRQIGDMILRQQQLELLVPAQRIARTQQCRQRAALHAK